MRDKYDIVISNENITVLIIVLGNEIDHTHLDAIIFAVIILVINVIDDQVNNNMIVYH